MKTTIKRHRRRMTKHGKHGKHGKGTTKGTTKHRKSIRNRKYKTRRQSGGGGWESFIKAGKNPIAPVADNHNDPELLFQMLNSKGKGIDVKFKTDATGQRMWLIGGDGFMDATFSQLKNGAKDGRYQRFIRVLLEKYPDFDNFEDMKLKKGIKLTNQQFCELFIDENSKLNYPMLKDQFGKHFACSSGAGTSAAPPPSAAPSGLYQFEQLQQIKQRIKDMGYENVTDKMIAQALHNEHGIMDRAVNKLINKLIDAQNAPPGARGGPSSAVRPFARGGIIEEAVPKQQKATIVDFVQAQNGTLPIVLGGGSCTTYDQALYEITQGKKESHWIWYIIPSSPGYKTRSKFFGIDEHANVTPEEYLSNWILSIRYIKILNAIGAKLREFLLPKESFTENDVKQFLVTLMGSEIDYDKLKKSLTIFSNALKTQDKVTTEIALLAEFLGVQQLHAQPLGPPPGTSAAPPPSAAVAPQYVPSTVSVAPQQSVDQLVQMGFEKADVINALNSAEGDVEIAATMLISAAGNSGTSAAPMSAAGTSAAPQSQRQVPPSAAFRSPEQPFPVRDLSFKPKMADLMVPDNFVINYAKDYGIHFDEKESYYPDKLGRTLRNFTACPDVANWTVKYTIGDMNCLTHAFLQCTSSMYRKIHVTNIDIQAEKTGVARAFRLAFADMKPKPDILHDTAKQDLLNNGGMADLGDVTFASYARLFGVILVVFDVRNGQVMVANLTQETAIPHMPVIFIHGDGGHFSSVLPPIRSGSNPSGSNPFVIKYEHAKQIECLKNFPNEAALND